MRPEGCAGAGGRRIRKLAGWLVLVAALSGCASYSSQPFTPASPGEQEILGKARKDVYPGQVRQDAARYRDTELAWAGIVSDLKIVHGKGGTSVAVLVEHRYFNWMEDHGAQPERFFLSPRGEGKFLIFLQPKGEMTESKARALIPAGTMVVAAGRIYVPSAADPRYPLALLADYYQFIRKEAYRTDVFDYGREGGPVRRVEGSPFWKQYGPH
jgi:hypothetical protein